MNRKKVILFQTLESAPTEIDCSGVAEVKKRLGEDTDSFWQDLSRI